MKTYRVPKNVTHIAPDEPGRDLSPIATLRGRNAEHQVVFEVSGRLEHALPLPNDVMEVETIDRPVSFKRWG